ETPRFGAVLLSISTTSIAGTCFLIFRYWQGPCRRSCAGAVNECRGHCRRFSRPRGNAAAGLPIQGSVLAAARTGACVSSRAYGNAVLSSRPAGFSRGSVSFRSPRRRCLPAIPAALRPISDVRRELADAGALDFRVVWDRVPALRQQSVER